MKDRFKKNLGLKVMAVFFAIFLWWTVVNVDDPVETKRFVTEVTVTNPEVITNTGKSYQIVDNVRNVTVTVKARRKIISEIRSSDIIATADLREMQDSFVPVRIRIIGFEGAYEEASANPRNIQIKTEEIQKKTFQIVTVATGNVRDGYVVHDMQAQPQTIDISGPKSSIGRINKVVARVDISELMEDAEVQAELIYYDSADNVIEKKLLSSNCDKNGVTVKVILWKTKKVEIEFDTSGIKPAQGYLFANIETEPEMVEIAGNRKTLESLKTIVIPPNVLAREGMTENEEVVVDISQYLPEGVVLADEDGGNVVVKLLLEKIGTKSLTIPVRSIRIDGLSEELEVSYGPEQEIELLFTGPNEVLQNLSGEQLMVNVDLSEYMQEGVYDVPVHVEGLPQQCDYVEGSTVQIVLTKK